MAVTVQAESREGPGQQWGQAPLQREVWSGPPGTSQCARSLLLGGESRLGVGGLELLVGWEVGAGQTDSGREDSSAWPRPPLSAALECRCDCPGQEGPFPRQEELQLFAALAHVC